MKIKSIIPIEQREKCRCAFCGETRSVKYKAEVTVCNKCVTNAEETMYDRIKRMTKEEMRQFVYWAYLCGNRDGAKNLEDSPNSYFGGHMLNLEAKTVMPSDDINDLWDTFEEIFNK